ncbi:hypothetical protein CHS0354_031859 [Potamilus streckersoni]|uniref:Uncharacterized protein n=1 Tax=Potamilus streckersoni TaxID=2493646 RepID=A0AAE0RXP5_9BIVA|nr:hypothetical protein CHS0354_031859 [Potamilus streckersoni]
MWFLLTWLYELSEDYFPFKTLVDNGGTGSPVVDAISGSLFPCSSVYLILLLAKRMSLPCYPWSVDRLGLSEGRKDPEFELIENESQEWLKRAKGLLAYAKKDLNYMPEMI